MARREGKSAQAKLQDPVSQYARDVVDGKIVAGRLVILACERHLRDLEEGPKRGLKWDLPRALMAIEFFPTVLVHWKGKFAGEPFVLEPFQMFVIGSLFGWVWAKTGLRRFRRAYEELARKNGKSAKAAGVALLLLIMDEEQGAEIYSAATKKDQARLVWGDAEKFVRKSPALRRRVQLFRHSMLMAETNSVFVPLSADEHTMDGLNPHGAIVDEVHAHKTRGVVDVLKTGMGAREQPLLFMITTSGKSVDSVCWDERDYAVKVLEGVFDDDTLFAYVACLDPGDDWQDEKCWVKANPCLGVSKSLDYMRAEAREARNKPAALLEFKRLHLCIWTESSGGAVAMAKWNACATPVDDATLKGRECVVGLDLSSTTDITAKVELFPPVPDLPLWLVRPTFWVPEGKIIAAEQGEIGDEVPYHLWRDQGFLRASDGDVVDYAKIVEDIQGRAQEVRIREIGFDPWNATQIANELQSDGFQMVEVRQGYKTMSEPTKKLTELVLAKMIAHGGHPVLRWMMSNLALVTDDAGNVKPSKRVSKQRIDGAVALIVALQRGLALFGAQQESVYQSRGVMVL
jgi:phage terminase large subunit-like protein